MIIDYLTIQLIDIETTAFNGAARPNSSIAIASNRVKNDIWYDYFLRHVPTANPFFNQIVEDACVSFFSLNS